MAEQSQSNVFTDVTAELLSLGACVRFQATGQSMYPAVKDGEIIKVEPVEPSHIKKGDIVLYRMKKGVIAHRVVRIERRNGGPPFFVLRGDALETCDGIVEPRQVIGRVISVERNGRDYKLNGIYAKLFHNLRFYASSLRRRLSQIPLARRLYVYLKARACPVE
jgi:signal peptidase I